MSALINNRYRVIRELGHGGMGTVYLIEDTLNADQIITLKKIRRDLLDERALTQFRYEFAALAQLRHPNLVTVYDFGIAEDTQEYFFTMEYVPGEDLVSYATRRRQETPNDYDWIYDITVQVCRALQYIHSRGLIHYDIKPRNIFVMPDNTVKLMDFGLIGRARAEGPLKLRGTPDYVAPELIRGDAVDHRADLYSLGITLYEIVTGKLPFQGDSTMTILRQHVEAQPDIPRHFGPDVPEALRTIILKLLAKDPVNRYASANEIIRAINTLAGRDYPVETRETRLGYIQSGNFIGREFELARLQGVLMRTLQGQGRLVLIGGPAGIGKSRLVRELRLRAQLQRVFVTEGAAEEHARAPYHPWINALRQLIVFQQGRDPDLVRGHAPMLVRLMPALRDVLPDAQELPETTDRSTLLQAVARFILASGHPLLIILEDLQYVDTESVELLRAVAEQAGETTVMICALFRDEDVSEGHPLRGLLQQARVISRRRESRHSSTPSTVLGEQKWDLLRLEALDDEATADLVRSMLGVRELPAGLLERILIEAGGNPLFIESLMHSLVDEDLLFYDGSAWRVRLEDFTRIPTSIQEVVERRLKRLDAETLDLLQWAAVMGLWIDLEHLSAATGLAPEQVFTRIAQAAHQHILVSDEQAGITVYRFATDQMRMAMYERLPEDERRRRHQRMADTLRDTHPIGEVAELLVWHYERAGDRESLLTYARIAADKARQVYANQSAVDFYSRALAALPEPHDLRLEYELRAGRQTCYRLMGLTQEQQADLQAMAQLASQLDDVHLKVEVATRQVQLANALGNLVEARAAAQEALLLAQQVGDARLEASSLISLGDAIFSLGDHQQAQGYYERAIELYRSVVDDKPHLARALLDLGNIHRRAGRLNEAGNMIREALSLFREVGDRQGESDAYNALGILSSDYAEQRFYYEHSLAISRAIGNRSGMARTYNNLGLIYAGLGLYTRAREYLEQAVQIQRDLHARASLTYTLESLGRVYLDTGDYLQAQQVFEEGRALAIDVGDRWTESIYWMGLGRVALMRGHLANARELLREACAMQREIGTLGYLAASMAWLAKVYLEQGEWSLAEQTSREACALLEQAGDAGDFPAQDIWWIRYQVLKRAPERTLDEPLDDAAWAALDRARETMFAGVATLSDEGLRRNYFNKVATNRDILIEWTRQNSKRKEEAVEAGEAEAVVAAEVEAPGVMTSADRLQERLRRVLDISVQMNETHDAEALLNYIMDQVIELSGAERGFLVLLDQDGRMNFRVARGIAIEEIQSGNAQISYSVLGTVTQSRMPVLIQDTLTDERFGQQSSVLQLNLRSVLCVPFLSGSELVGLIYADNRSISGRFSQADVDLLMIFANQAATAIENARLYEATLRANRELEAWARTLEERVAERTAELRAANQTLMRRAAQLEIANQVGRQVTSILDPALLLPQVVQLIKERFGYYFVGVWLFDMRSGVISLAAGTGDVGKALKERGFSITVGTTSLLASVCSTGQPRVVNDVHKASDFLMLKELPAARSELVLPLRVGSLILGALDIMSEQVNGFSAEDQMVYQILADQIAVAMRNAELYRNEQRRRRLAESMERAGRVLSSSLNLKEVPVRILEQLAEVVPYGRGALFLREGDQLTLVAQRGFPDDPRVATLAVSIRPGDVFTRMAQTREFVRVDDVRNDPGWKQVDWLPLHASFLGIPLIAQDEAIGMISLTREGVAAFTDEDATLAKAFAGQASIALENARLYNEIASLNEHLEQKVRERTEELNRAYQALERLDRTKSDFINVAAHELRTPLTVIKGYAQVLNAGADPTSPQKSLVEGIQRGVERLHEIVNSMLDVAKISTEQLALYRQPVKLAHIIDNVALHFREALQERHLTLTVEGVETLPIVYCDPDMMYKVFHHLTMNAIKYTPDGGRITISGTYLPDAEPEMVQIVVADTGIGIAKEHQELIFERFYQTGEVSFHSSGKTKFKGGGPGLGLAIAKGAVVAHQGRIWVESEGYDEKTCPGSRFYVQIPVGKK